MNLALLAYEMRAAGIKSLALELDTLESPPTLADDSAPDTEAPPAEAKDPTLCVAVGCGEKAGGIFNGVAGQYCRAHAFAAAGVRT